MYQAASAKPCIFFKNLPRSIYFVFLLWTRRVEWRPCHENVATLSYIGLGNMSKGTQLVGICFSRLQVVTVIGPRATGGTGPSHVMHGRCIRLTSARCARRCCWSAFCKPGPELHRRQLKPGYCKAPEVGPTFVHAPSSTQYVSCCCCLHQKLGAPPSCSWS